MDNLPIPQSRIEELMNAFISRDSSQISTPQSRIEEFWYHLIEGTNALPIPQSRIELLLKKIIENDTKQIPLAKSRAEEFLVSILTGDINKLPIPQSRSEYYLDYIARNNLVLDDIEYLKYNGTNITATNTVQKPFKSAILKGQTLVNLLDTEMLKDDNNINAIAGVTLDKDYFISDHTAGQVQISKDNKSPLEGKLMEGKTYTLVMTVNTTDKTSDGADVYFGLDTTTHTTAVKLLYNANGVVKIKFTPSVKETPSTRSMFQIGFYNRAVVKISRKIMLLEGDYTNVDIPYFTGMQSVKMPVLKTSNEDGTKTNILTTPEDLELRGIGDVKDTLDCLTGELTERIGEVVLDGSEDWKTHSFGYVLDSTPLNMKHITTATNQIATNFIADKLPVVSLDMLRVATIDCIAPSRNTYKEILICSETVGKSNLNEFKEWLSQNPITIQYELAQESIKTVDLKVVDQDGNPVNQLSAFDSTTHIISDSESDNSLIAIAEVEVPTKLIEALNAVKSLSSDVEMLINEVDNAQKLQDENSTMVMSAMTELYEMVLVMGGGS